jgi:hypothetical protein
MSPTTHEAEVELDHQGARISRHSVDDGLPVNTRAGSIGEAHAHPYVLLWKVDPTAEQ